MGKQYLDERAERIVAKWQARMRDDSSEPAPNASEVLLYLDARLAELERERREGRRRLVSG